MTGTLLLRFACIGTLLALAVVGCGPVYHTSYSYRPPESSEGLRCTTNCQLIEQQCETQEELRTSNCEMRAELSYNNCMSFRRYDYKGKCTHNCYCSRPYCANANLEACKIKYNQCYQTCGGHVTATTTCVRNCEKEEDL